MADLLGTQDDERKIIPDYLGRDAELQLSGRPALPVGGAPVGATAPTGPGGTGGPGATPGPAGTTASTTGGPAAGGGVPQWITDAMVALRGGSKIADIAKRFPSFSGPATVPSSDILDGAPSGAPQYDPSRFSAPAPAFGGAGSGALSGADASLATGAEQGATELGGSGLGMLSEGLAVAGPTIGMIPRWAQGKGGPPVNDVVGGAGSAVGPIAALASNNPAGAFAMPIAGVIGGILEATGVVGTSHHQNVRNDEMKWLSSRLPDYAEHIGYAQTPDEIAQLLAAEQGYPFQYDAASGTVSGIGNTHLQGDVLSSASGYLTQAAQTQIAIQKLAQQGHPQAMEYLQQGAAKKQQKIEEASRLEAERLVSESQQPRWDAGASA